jgi:iron complex transport system substrate-binding protein
MALAGVAPALAEPAAVTLRDDTGHTQRWALAPQRIISLTPALTETVCALGGCARVVGVDRHSNFPESVQRLPQLGGLGDTPIERIVQLRPDVVLLAPSSRLHERLRALGIPTLVLDTRSQADVRRALLMIGQLLRVNDPLAVWRALEQSIAQAARGVPAAARGVRVYYEVDRTPYAAGASSFIGQTLAQLGANNIVGAEWGDFPQLNPEFVVQANPGLIIVSQAEARALAERPGWATIGAVRQGRVCGLSSAEAELIARPSPRLGQAAQILVRCLSLAASPQHPSFN